MKFKLTTLCENTAGKPGFAAEWGLSILIETEDTTVLFDTGRSSVALSNADKMGIDLRKIDRIVLSHGHHDHTGGLREVLNRTGDMEIVAHPAVWENKYTKRPYEAKEAYCGIPFAREELESLGGSFVLTSQPFALSDRITTTGEIDMTVDYETIEPSLLVKEGNKFIPDIFRDDLSIVVRTDEGLVVVLGCAHRGTINTIHHAQRITGEERIYAIIGGTHLFPASDERVERTINELIDLDVKKVGISHCNGFYASMRVAQALGDRFFLNNAGTQITLP
ncbi:MAG: MBL fold metallo-hydrolase [Deltaproteobacteria bacterium]|nr:MBL fold metallo-hydrolase [Deltaproteobacteria bacterium]